MRSLKGWSELTESKMGYDDFFKRDNRNDFIRKAIAGEIKIDGDEVLPALKNNHPFIQYLKNNHYKTDEMKTLFASAYGIAVSKISKDDNGFSGGRGGSKEPTGAEWEVIICAAYNMKSQGVDKAEAIKNAGQINAGGDDVEMIWKDKYDDYLEKGLEIVDSAFGTPSGTMKHYGSGVSELTNDWNQYFQNATGKDAHASTKTPKTDMYIGKQHISLKKQGGSQLMSGGKGETLATLGFAYDYYKKDPSYNKDLDAAWHGITKDITDHFFKKSIDLPDGMTTTDLKKGKSTGELQSLIKEKMTGNTELTKRLQDLFETKELKREVVHEAMTGRSKFKTKLAKSTHMMIFNDGGYGKFYPIDDSVINRYTSKTNFNISFKSSGTGGKAWIGLKGIFKEEVVDTTELDNIIEWAINDTNQEILQEGIGSWMRSGVRKLKSVAAKTKDFVIKWIQRIMKKIWGKIKKLITSSISALQNLLGVKMVVRNNPQITF
jgi:hypothetical protein